MEDEALEFQGDVFEFAKASGLTVNLAKVEVMRTMAGWKAAKGLRFGGKERGEELEPATRNTEGHHADTKRSGDKKRKRGGKTAEDSSDVVDGEAAQPSAKRQRNRENKKRLSGLATLASHDANFNTSTPKIKTNTATVVKDIEASKQKGKVTNPITAEGERSALAMKREKRKQKRLRQKSKLKLKQGPTSSSYFPPKDASVSESKSLLDAETKPESTVRESIEDGGTYKGVLEGAIGETKEAGIFPALQNDRKRRRKKRNNNRLPDSEISVPSANAANDPATGTLAQAGKQKQIPADNISGSPPLAKKMKRVRSKVSKGDTEVIHLAATDVGVLDVIQPVAEAKDAESPAKCNEQPPKKKTRNRKQKLELKTEGTARKVTANSEAKPIAEPIVSGQPAQKKRRQRGAKSVGKADVEMADVEMSVVEELTAPVEPLVELPSTNSETLEKNNKNKRKRSRKRSSRLPEMQDPEPLNSTHP